MSMEIVCILTIQIKYFKRPRVKSGNFRRQVNSDIHLQIVEIGAVSSGFSLFAYLIYFYSNY